MPFSLLGNIVTISAAVIQSALPYDDGIDLVALPAAFLSISAWQLTQQRRRHNTRRDGDGPSMGSLHRTGLVTFPAAHTLNS